MASNVIGKGAIKFRKVKLQVSREDDEVTHPFVYLNYNTPPQEVVTQIMAQEWEMELPKIIVSIISNAKALATWKKTSTIQAFQKGIINAANSTEMWIITPGFNVGISKAIGDAIKDELKQVKVFGFRRRQKAKMTVIGVCKEKRIKQTELLEPRKDEEEIELETNGNSVEEKKYELNPNHSHFIIVKEPTERNSKMSGVNHFQFNLVHLLSRTPQIDKDDSKEKKEEKKEKEEASKDEKLDAPKKETADTNTLPVVSVVIQGGFDCARLVYSHIERKIPVVAIRGSGGLADIIAYGYKETHYRGEIGGITEWDEEYVRAYVVPELINKILSTFPDLNQQPDKLSIFCDLVIQIIQFSFNSDKNYLTILDMFESNVDLSNLSEYLLRAIFSSQHAEGSSVDDKALFVRDLYLTLDWNCPAVAKSEVLDNDESAMSKIDKGIFEAALIRPDREEFIGLFLSKGMRIHKMLKGSRLRSLFKKVHEEEFFKTICWETILGNSSNQIQGKNFIENDLNFLINVCTEQGDFIDSERLNQNASAMYAFTTENGAERYAIAVLCIWAIFSYRPKLLRVLWKHSDQPIHLALMISIMFDKLSKYPEDGSKIKSDLENQSEEFANMATGVLEDGYTESPTRAMRVLSDPSAEWNGKAAIDIASHGQVKTFIAHRCCQKWLTDMFMGKVQLRTIGFFSFPSYIKVILCAFLIFPMYFWTRFTYNTKSSSKQSEPNEEEDDSNENDPDKIVVKEMRSIEHKKNIKNLEVGQGVKDIEKAVDKRGKLRRLRESEFLVRNQPPLWQMIKMFWEAPITKFWTSLVFYLLYLTLFCFAVLWPHCGNTYLDVILSVWTALIGIDYMIHTYHIYIRNPSFNMIFRMAEIVIIMTFVTHYFISQFAPASKEIYSPFTKKIVLCLGLLYFFYRLIFNYFLISPLMGPLLYRIKLMIFVDFLNYLQMTILVMISSGIAIQAVLYPDKEFNGKMIRKAVHRAAVALFLTPIEELKPRSGCVYRTEMDDDIVDQCYVSDYEPDCPNPGFWAYVFVLQYLVLLKIILLTVLFAMFAATASRLSGQTENIWKHQRYIIVTDFANRAPLPPPLVIFYYEYLLVKWIVSRLLYCCGCKKATIVHKERSSLTNEEYSYWQSLAQEYADREDKKKEDEDLSTRQWQLLQRLNEEIEYTENLLRQLRSKITVVEQLITNATKV